MPTGKKQATIVEIARIANTSTATVSRVLSGADYPVSEALREAVKKAAREMNYVPNAIGQSLKIGKSQDIGVIIPNFTNPFYMQMISGIESVCRKEGYNPIFCSSNNDSAREIGSIELLRRKCVEGLILSSIHKSAKALQAALRLHKHVVLFDQEATLDTCDYVSFDFESGGFLAVDYLLKHGHRRIAFLTAPLENRASRSALYRGCQQAVRQWPSQAYCELISTDVQVEDYKTWEYENGRLLAREFLQLSPLPTAAFVYNDVTAIGVMSQLAADGVRIPEDVSVMGFDNIINAEYTTPPLTTVSQPAFDTGAMATRIIRDKIMGTNMANCRINLHPQLIERKSVKNLNDVMEGDC